MSYKSLLTTMFFIFLTSICFSADLSINISWNQMDSDILGIIQYNQPNSMEEIKGYSNSTSKDGNIKVSTNSVNGSTTFIIKSVSDCHLNLWLINPFIDEDFDDMNSNPFSNANVKISINNRFSAKDTILTIPNDLTGLVCYVGTVMDGSFIPEIKMYNKMRVIDLKIVNALNGEPLTGTEISINKPPLRKSITKGTTDLEGRYSTQLDYGKYTMLISKQDYITYKYSTSVSLSGLPVSSLISLTPKSKKYRIILTWNQSPSDLDAHLTGPKPEGGIFHIWWNNKTLISGKNFLDRDDMNSYGPETITIYKPAIGEYEYAVHNYSGRSLKQSKALSYSGAKVEIYANNSLQNTFNITPGKSGTVWKVFKIDNELNIIPIDEYYYKVSSKTVFEN